MTGCTSSFRYFPSLRQLGLPRSRDRAAQRGPINAAEQALRAADYDVQVVINEDDRRTFAEAEADRTERAEDRADRAQSTSNTLRAEADRRRRSIPLGQPMMPDHYSYNADRNFRDRTHRMEGKAIAEGDRAAYLAGRADSAANYQRYRNNPGTTLRRINKLEADLRQVHKWLAGESAGGTTRSLTPDGVAELHREEEEIAEQLTYWRTIIAEAEAKGFKVWGKADFTKGDFARSRGRWYQVLRVNAKSLTVPGGPEIQKVITTENREYSWDDRLPYDEVTGRRSPEEMRAALEGSQDTPKA